MVSKRLVAVANVAIVSAWLFGGEDATVPEELTLGETYKIERLQKEPERKCYSVDVKSGLQGEGGSGKVLIRASVVGLVGDPFINGGWDLESLGESSAADSHGGFQILEVEEELGSREKYHVCVR